VAFGYSNTYKEQKISTGLVDAFTDETLLMYNSGLSNEKESKV
jgi:hypothetical protein